MGRRESQESNGPRDDAPGDQNRSRPAGRNGLPPQPRTGADQPMAQKHHPSIHSDNFRVRSDALEEALVGLGQATEGFILSHSWLPHKTVPEDRERNLRRGGDRTLTKGCPLGRASVGRFRVTAEHWRLSLHIYRRRIRAGWAYEMLLQYSRDRDLPMVKLRKRILAGDQPAKHPEG